MREMLENSWEDNIRYLDCYTWDRDLIPGYCYQIKDGNIERVDNDLPLEGIREVFKKSTPSFLKTLEGWLPLFMSPVTDYRRAAIDIEVAVEAMDRIPDPKVGRNQVICASLAGSDGLKRALVLRRAGVEEGSRPKELSDDLEIKYFDDELELLKELFRYMVDYPIIITFNGDNFDLPYLWKRGQVLGLRKEEIPIILGREIALLPIGVHFDLYKFFKNHAIQIYAFGNAYREVALDSVAGALLNMKKIPIEGTVSEQGYLELASYCYRDSLLTLRLTTENSSLVMNLVTMVMRVSRLSMEDVTRQGVSRWIRSLFFYEHRAGNFLIPRQEDIEKVKGNASTTAIIKGKKYQGAMVIKPESKVYFDVVVLDFASLYPSIISRWNLSYETVNCAHPSCRSNIVPDTKHWVCREKVGMMGLVIGMLRDIRVRWFKVKSKDSSLSKEERNWYNVVQQALKVILNASYGVFGAQIFPLYCLPLADSTTAIGRHIITETINMATGSGLKVVYGDSVPGEAKVICRRNGAAPAEVPIGELFTTPQQTGAEGKEYCYPDDLRAVSVDHEGRTVWGKVNYVMRHRTGKKMYRVWLSDSWYIDATEDHSFMGCKRGQAFSTKRLVESRPSDLESLSHLITIHDNPAQKEGYSIEGLYVGHIKKIEQVPHDGYVYDLEIEGTHCFFANRVLVHNTDSIFLYKPTGEQISKLLGWAESNFGIDLEVDKRYTFVTFSGRKKNYLGVLESGVVDIKGLMGKKRNTPVFIKSAFSEMTQVLREVKDEKEFEKAKTRIKQIVQNCYSGLKNRRYPLDELTFKVMLSRPVGGYRKTTPQHVKAAKQLEDKGKDVKPGDIISYVKVQGSVGVKPVQLARIDEVDVEKYVGHIESTFGQVLEALGIEFDEIVGIKRLDFFSR
jgi:DNA polymerase elongation subunit (family B)